MIDQARRAQRVTWIGAPAGAGKTTLVASYTRSRRLACLWLDVDAGDRDVASFFHYLGLAAARAIPLPSDPLPKLTPEYFETADVFARNFFRELGRRIRQPLLLVIDNAQELGPDVLLHEMLCEGLLELPSTAHTVLISRATAPAAFARMRVTRQLAEIGWEQLRLTETEAREVVRSLGRGASTPPNDEIDALNRRCEGWIAGLMLLLDASRENAVPTTEAAAHPQSLFDYFAAEVFARRPPAVREFLMLTALFPTFTAAMAGRLTGYPRTAATLNDLVRQHRFTERRTDSLDSYQFHPLFRAFLLERAAAAWGAAELAHHRHRAAVILEQAGRLEDALPLYLESGDSDAAARLILARAPDLSAAGRHTTLSGLLERLPGSDVERDGWLLYWRGASRLPFLPTEARIDLEAAYARFDTEDDSAGLYLAWSAIVESYFVEYHSYQPTDRWIPEFRSLRRRFPEFPSVEVEARAVHAAVGVLLYRFISHALLPGLVARLETLMQTIPDTRARGLLGVHSVMYYTQRGELDRADRVLLLMRPPAERTNVDPAARITWYGCASNLAWLHGNASQCLQYSADGEALIEEHGLPVLRLLLLNQGIHGALLLGDTAGATRFQEKVRAALQQPDDVKSFMWVWDSRSAADRVVARRPGDINEALYHYTSSMIAAHKGDLEEAEAHGMTTARLTAAHGLPFGRFCGLLAASVAAFLRGDRAKGLEVLGTAHSIGTERESALIVNICRFTEAAFSLEHPDRAGALAALRDALATSRERDGPGFPWLPHHVLARAYGTALEHGIEIDHVTTLIRKFEIQPTDDVLHVDAWPWPVKLYTLGHFRVVVRGAPLEFPTKTRKKPLELLKALVALGGRGVREDTLADRLWPEADAERAALALTTTLHRLRKLIGDDAVKRQDGRLALNPRLCWLDVWSLERLLAGARRVCRGGSSAEVAKLAEKLLSLYRGPFLSEQDEQPWVLATRERLRGKLVRALGTMGDALTQGGAHQEAALYLDRALEIDPLAEYLYRALMRTQIASKHHADALTTYRRCRRMLRVHLEVEPSADTEALRQRIPRSATPPRESEAQFDEGV